jgi:hypothetical protein
LLSSLARPFLKNVILQIQEDCTNTKEFSFIPAQTICLNTFCRVQNTETPCVRSVSLANSKIHQSEKGIKVKYIF